jgi:hypothetical protein
MFKPALDEEGFQYLWDNLTAICINIPGSLLQPGIFRYDEFDKIWRSTMKGPNGDYIPVRFLQNPCTPAEIAENPYLTYLAMRHDTFYPPGLKKELMAQYFPDYPPEVAKGKAIGLAKGIILKNWDILINILKCLEFKNCQSEFKVGCAMGQLGLFETIAQSGQLFGHVFEEESRGRIMVGLLDATRTMLTRTACTESHRRAYEFLSKETTGKLGLILEDDLFIDPRFPDQLVQIMRKLVGENMVWDILQLGYSITPATVILPVDDLFVGTTTGVFGNTAVLVNSPKRVLQILEEECNGEGEIRANDVVLAKMAMSNRLAKKRYIGPPKTTHLSEVTGLPMDYRVLCYDGEDLE